MKYDELYGDFLYNMLQDDIIQCISENDDIALTLNQKIDNAVDYCVDNDVVYDNLELFVQEQNSEEIISYMGIEHCLKKYKFITITKLCMDVLADELTPEIIRNWIKGKIVPRAARVFICRHIADLRTDMCSIYICNKCPAKVNGKCILDTLQGDIADGE